MHYRFFLQVLEDFNLQSQGRFRDELERNSSIEQETSV